MSKLKVWTSDICRGQMRGAVFPRHSLGCYRRKRRSGTGGRRRAELSELRRARRGCSSVATSNRSRREVCNTPRVGCTPAIIHTVGHPRRRHGGRGANVTDQTPPAQRREDHLLDDQLLATRAPGCDVSVPRDVPAKTASRR